MTSGAEDKQATPKRIAQLLPPRTPATKRQSEDSVEEIRLSNTPGSLKRARTSRRTPQELAEKITQILTPGYILSAFTNNAVKSCGVVQVLGTRHQNGITWVKLCDSEHAVYNCTGASPEVTAELKRVKRFEIVRIRSAYRKGFILYIEAIDRNQDVKSSEYLVVKDGLDSCTFIGRDFLQQVAVAAGAGSENGLDMRHDFFITKTPIRMRR